MGYFLFDSETTGLNPETDKIITIQYQEIDNFGKPVGEMTILKEWEEGEEAIIKKGFDLLFKGYSFNFIPVMQNHLFDFRFLFSKFKKYNLPLTKEIIDYIYDKPYLDIQTTLIMINDLKFKGCGLSSLTRKEQDGKLIPSLYEQKDFNAIEDYIKQEAKSFLYAFENLCKELPKLKSILK